MSDLKKIWECTIFVSEKDIPNGADYPPREAAINAVESLGLSVTACTSGWGCEEFTPKIAKLKTQNQQLKQRIGELESALSNLFNGFRYYQAMSLEEKVELQKSAEESLNNE